MANIKQEIDLAEKHQML